jgi:hypothetical protein
MISEGVVHRPATRVRPLQARTREGHSQRCVSGEPPA